MENYPNVGKDWIECASSARLLMMFERRFRTLTMLFLASAMLTPSHGVAHASQYVGRTPAFGSKECPADELSCGKQKPMRSDGKRPFENEDMGLSVVFPRGTFVCRGRSGDAPRGFYTWFGVPMSCNERVPAHLPAYMGISASWNALDWTSPKKRPS